jgi:TetR/AcrR family transcriptional repressor of nem operon
MQPRTATARPAGPEAGDRKSSLVAAALGMVMLRGYDSFSYADLAAQSGITKASIHHHFPNKEDVGLAVLDAVEQMIRGQMTELQRVGADKALLRWAKEAGQFEWGRRICPLSSMHAEFNVLPTKVQQRLAEVTALEVASVADLVRAHARATAEAPAMAPETAAQLLLSAAKGALLYGRTLGGRWLVDVMRESLRTVFPRAAATPARRRATRRST